jgi:carbon-monoxide dehydrogenase small subunit
VIEAQSAQGLEVTEMRTKIKLTVNGHEHEVEVENRMLLADLLRELGYLSVHIGCDDGKCGACTVILDGAAVKSCMVFAVQANGSTVMTAEGLSKDGLHPLQEEFWKNHAVQCGYCTPGMLMTIYDYLSKTDPGDIDEQSVRRALTGNLCRCTGYVNIVKATLEAAKRKKGGEW